MLYDRDVWQYKIIGDKVFLEYIAPTEEAVFTKYDLLKLLKQMEEAESLRDN